MPASGGVGEANGVPKAWPDPGSGRSLHAVGGARIDALVARPAADPASAWVQVYHVPTLPSSRGVGPAATRLSVRSREREPDPAEEDQEDDDDDDPSKGAHTPYLDVAREGLVSAPPGQQPPQALTRQHASRARSVRDRPRRGEPCDPGALGLGQAGWDPYCIALIQPGVLVGDLDAGSSQPSRTRYSLRVVSGKPSCLATPGMSAL